MPDDMTMNPDGGMLAKALQVRLTAVLADGGVVRFETGHPAVVSVKMPGGDVPLSVLGALARETRYDRVTLNIEQAAPYTVQHATVHTQTAVSWDPRLAYEEYAGQTVGEREPDEEAAFTAGVGAFLDSITEPADEGRFTVTLHDAGGGTGIQHCDHRELARTLINMAQAPHVVQAADRWVIERAGENPPRAAERAGELLANTLRYVLADLGINPDDERVRAVVARRLNQGAKITMDGLR